MIRRSLHAATWAAVWLAVAAARPAAAGNTLALLPPLPPLPFDMRLDREGAPAAQQSPGRDANHPLTFELPSLPVGSPYAEARASDADARDFASRGGPGASIGAPEGDPDHLAGLDDLDDRGGPGHLGDTGTMRDTGRKVATASHVGPGSADRPEAAGATPAEPLEGPPVPLAPVERMSAGQAQATVGNAPGDDKPITLHFRDANLADVLDAFARFTGLNIVASARVRGTVSLHLSEVPWRSAFDTLLEVNGLAMARRDNVIWVAPVAELAARERLRFEAHARAADLEPLASRTFVLRYPRAEDVQRLLTAPGAQRVLSRRGAAMADARTNLLFVTDLAGRLDQVAELIAAIDTPSRQVLIEARIVEGARGFSRELGARLSVRKASAPNTAGALGEQADKAGSAGPAGGGSGLAHDLAARAVAGFDAGTAGLTLFAARATRFVTVELSALEQLGRGQVVSSPRIVTADRAKATVEQGTELPYQVKVRNGVSGIQFRRATLKLDVEPQITPNGRVILDLDIAKDSVGAATAAGPAIDTKHVRTRVEVEDGGTVLIGGIYETQDRDDVTRVPLLGKIPVVGAFFRHRARREQASELAVFITPRVVSID